MKQENDEKREKAFRFVARHYREGALDEKRAWSRFARQQGIVRQLPWRRYLTGAAAVMLLLLGVGSLIIYDRMQPDWVVIATDIDRQEIYLPDNTMITLAGNSEIRYDKKQYGKERRAVQLTGKAFFEVQRDEACPFSVSSEQARVTVLGTSFQIEEREQATEVYVESGKVAFEAGNEQAVLLTAGMKALYGSKEKIEVDEEPESGNRLSWKTGELRFSETPLDRVMEDLHNHYRTRIVCDTETTEELKLTAQFADMSLEDVLFIINQTLDINLRVEPATNR